MVVLGKASNRLNSKVVANAIFKDQGELKEQIAWSKDKQSYQNNFVNITSKGELNCVDQVFIKSLLSCAFRVMENGVIYIEAFETDEFIYLKTFEKDIFTKIFSALLFWQGLRPKGITNKRISKVFDIQETNDDTTLLVASCKIYAFAPKGKNLELVEGPHVTLYTVPNAAWFTAMVTLKSDGILQLINERDGQLLYTFDIKKLKRSEIRELHHSIFESSNYLFVGIIEELRSQGLFKNHYESAQVVPEISAEYPKVKKIILEFPYRIDVEDWLVALTSFTQREYAGLNKNNYLRISRKVNLSILDAKYNNVEGRALGGLYAEVQIWGMPWFRTSIVEQTTNPFFREEFELDLAISAGSAKVVLKEAQSQFYANSDIVLGELNLTFKKLEDLQLQDRIPLVSNGQPVGQIFLTYKTQRNYILPPENFHNIEQMILNLDFQQLLRKVLVSISQSDLEQTSVILLDIFQSLQKENEWFHALIEEEVKRTLSKDFEKKKYNEKVPELFNNLFRGNSFLTKSLELYNLRSGQEYLEKVIGDFVSQIIKRNESTEIDPNRLINDDPKLKNKMIETNFKILLKYVKEIWNRIYTSSNDLPESIKKQLTLLRKKIEIYTVDTTVALNAISAFLFLRFFCSVILNPKLFFLTKDHQTGDIKRTLTLIAKVLMTFANRSEFNVKEPYLMRFNDAFINEHKDELLDYLDKVTGKKLDFTEKKLKLSHTIERTDFVLASRSLMKELPTIPFLIDKYLRIDQLIDIVTNEKINPQIADDFGLNTKITDTYGQQRHRIGDLEFEKVELRKTSSKGSDFEFGSERFMKRLLDTNESEKVYNYINSESSLKDIIAEATIISNKKSCLIRKLSAAESINDLQELTNYIHEILSTTIVDNQKNVLKVTQPVSSNLKYLKNDSSYNNLKIKLSNSLFGDNDIFSISSRQSNSSAKIRITQIIKSSSSHSQSKLDSISEKNKRRPSGYKRSVLGRLFHRS